MTKVYPNDNNKFDGVGSHPEVDGCTDQDIKAGIRIDYPWKTGEGAPPADSFALGKNRPD